MEDELHINQKTFFQILNEYLGKSEVYIKCVPHSLLDEQKGHMVSICENFIQTSKKSPYFLKSSITGDKETSSWFQYDPETKHQSVEWRTESPERPKIFKNGGSE